MSTPVFILAGQSNAGGLAAEIEAALDDRYGIGNYELLNVFGPGAPLTWTRPNDPDWNDPMEMRQELTDGILNALDEDPDRVIGGMIWVQGEADTYAGRDHENYGEELEGMLDDLRDDVSDAMGDRDVGLDVAPVTILELSDNAPEAPNREGWDTIIDEQREVATADSLVTTLDPDRIAEDANVDEADMFKDGLHYEDDFQDLLAEELVETMLPPSTFEDEDTPGIPVDPPPPDVDPDEPILPVVDPPPPDLDEEESEPVNAFDDDGGSLGDMGWIIAFLPILGLMG